MTWQRSPHVIQKLHHIFFLIRFQSSNKQNHEKRFPKPFFPYLFSHFQLKATNYFLYMAQHTWMSFENTQKEILRSTNLKIEFQKVNLFPHDPKKMWEGWSVSSLFILRYRNMLKSRELLFVSSFRNVGGDVCRKSLSYIFISSL